MKVIFLLLISLILKAQSEKEYAALKFNSKCTPDYIESYLNYKACIINAEPSACMLLTILDDNSGKASLAATLGGGFAASMLTGQTKSAQAKFKEVLEGVRSERAALREAHKIKTKLDLEVAREVTGGKVQSRFDLDGSLREKADQLYKEKLSKLSRNEIRFSVSQYLKEESALKIYKARTGSLMGRIYGPELEKLKPYAQNLQNARDKLAQAQAKDASNVDELRKQVGVERRKLADLVNKSPELKVVNSLKDSIGYTLDGQNKIFKTASKLSKEIDGKTRAKNIKNATRGGAFVALSASTVAIAQRYIDKSAIEKCSQELSLSKKEVEVLKGEFNTLAGQVSGNQLIGTYCRKLSLLNPEEVLAAFDGEVPQGVCKIIENEMAQFEQINAIKLADVKSSCDGLKSSDLKIQTHPIPSTEFETQEGVSVKANIDAQTGWPNYRTAVYYRNGKQDKNLTLQCQQNYNFRHPPSANITDVDKLDYYLSKNDSCINIQKSALTRAVYSSSNAFCADQQNATQRLNESKNRNQ
ncbi:MAG: hypothetical protein IPM57_10355 [Oligoflexia bacterium]|nr:hypothetical protein [Oligoflexia bacterium]